MKKYLLLLFIPALAALNSCQKIDGVALNNGSYQPLSSGSYWKYTGSYNGTASSSTTTMTAGTAVFNNKTYHTATNTSSLVTGSQTAYYSVSNHFYIARGAGISTGIVLDMVYLNDALAAGVSWTSKVTDDGTVNGVPAQTIGTIVAVGLTKTVGGKTYTNVIHSKVDLQYNYGSGFSSSAIYDFYVAQGVGVIESDADLSPSGIVFTSTSILTEYSIK